MVEFRILGPLEVSSEGGPVRLGGGRQRAVLALLLLRLGEVVSTERLLEELWSDRPPATATKVVQLYVSRLRKSLGDGLLLTRAPGYVLRVDPERLDTHRFERLFEEGRQALRAGCPDTAATTLREALSLWRGPALADFLYEPFAQGEIARLEDLRLACLEERIEADLALGSHAELTGELEALISAQPMRERPRGQLMLALYRSGRQAEALAAYQQARQVLVEELGIEPSPALQRLEKAILNQEPELDPPAAPRPPAAASVETATIEPTPERSAFFEAGQERKLATAVFADLVGSTELGEGDPERTHLLLERFYDAMAAEIEAAGGTVEKFAGDAVMAVFGAPAAQEDHAVRALHAALAMRSRLAELFGETLSLHIGVDTGEVVVARPREGSSIATGNVVNVAARLEQAAAPGEILVGERTVVAARGAFTFDEPIVVEAKGKPGGVACRRLVRELSLARPRGVSGLRPAFVGREGELELLRATYRRALREEKPHLVTIMGEAGVGKTTLMRELWERLQAETPNARQLTGRCLAYGRGITYWPFGEILKQHLGLLESDPPDEVRKRLGGREILGLTLGLDVSELHPLEAVDRLHTAWIELLGELAAERPCTVLVEDLHWAEEPLLDLLERLLRDVHGPLLLLGTARPELLIRRPAWAGGRRNAASLWLEPLSTEETARLVETLLGAELAPPLSELVVERAEGNPFFLEELLATLIDTGVITHENGGWAAQEPPPGLVVPDSVQATLASRIDLLPAREKAALQAASVAGRVFWAAPVVELLGDEPDFALLEERDFVRRRPASTLTGEREYAIKHALTREVAYASLPKAKRARLHAAFAAWIERAGAGRDEHAPFLAHHYAEAVRPEDVDLVWAGEEGEHERLRGKALHWLKRASDLAIGRYAIDEALALLHRALELERSEAEQARLWLAIGQANALKYDGEALFAAMEKAIALATDPRMRVEACSELAYMTATRYGMWRRRPGAELVDGWIERAIELTDGDEGPERVKALAAKASWDPSQEQAAKEASRLAQRLGTAELRQAGHNALVEVALAAGRFDEALTHVSAELQLLPELTSPDDRSFVHWDGILANLGSGRIDDARRHAVLHDEILSRLTPHQVIHGIGMRLLVEELAGCWDAIRANLWQVAPAVEANVDTPCVLNPRLLLVSALVAARAGDDAEARRLEKAAEAIDMEGYGLTIAAPRLQLALLRDDRDTVDRLLELPVGLSYTELAARAARLDALAALRDRRRVEDEAVPLLRPDTYLEPFALRALGVVREDEKLVDQALARFEAMGLDWHAAQTRTLL